MKMKFGWYVVLCLLIGSCKSPKTETLFERVTETGIDFNNKVVDGEIENSFYYRNYYNGGGVGIADINNDGLCDVFMVSNMAENRLYLNKGDFKFEDITAGSGMKQDSMWSTGVVMTDINSDGWQDIYVCNSGHMKNGNRRNKLYINNKDLTFTESAASYGLAISAYTTQVSFFDYDLDGDLDCFMINNSPMPINNLGYNNRRSLLDKDWPVSEFLKGGGDHLFRNDNGVFKEVSVSAGIHGTLMSFGLGVSIGDINLDGYPDVYVANDSYERDYLYINQKNGTFKDEMEERIEQNSFSSMGADLADINNDGYMDIFTTDMLPEDDYRLKTLGAFDNIDLYNKRIEIGLYRQFMKNCLFVNTKDGRFVETANYSGVSATDWSWGALFFDADNDGLNDIFVCNGVNRDVTNLDFMDFFANDVVQRMVISGEKQSVDSVLKHIPVYPVPNKIYRNDGNLRFADAGQSWGFMEPCFSNGAGYGDLDNDGDLDLVVNNQNQEAFVYRNRSREVNGHNYIGVMLKGKGNNTFAIGSKIKVYHKGQVYFREVIPSRGFQSSVDYKQIIGLGAATTVDSLVISWPDRTTSSFANPALNKVHHLEQPTTGSRPGSFPVVVDTAQFLQKVEVVMEQHVEDKYIDFYYERNLPALLSAEGPRIATADVDGDGTTDVYIGGGKGQPGQLYVQTKKGLTRKENAVFKQFADFEDVATLFFDADKDGDADLFLGAGGNNARPGSRELQHRLYKNDGKGNLTIDTKAFPNNDMNIAVAASYDFDEDGYEDLFVGSRSMPYNYGLSPSSYLYRNDGNGHFKDVTSQLCPQLAKGGMITSAVWANVVSDAKKELIITGEWMPTRVFGYDNKSRQFLELKNTGLDSLHGWWQALSAGDVNGDGKTDLVIGNIGENFYLRPNATNPVKLWLNDFDRNGTTEQFLTRSVSGRDVPVYLKREITDQFPGLKKANLKHSDYASKSIHELFDSEILKNSDQLYFNYCSSVVAINNGNGRFSVQKLPMMVQLSSLNAIALTEVNADGKVDIIGGGNMFSFPPQFGRLDASCGHVLLNKGDGSFDWIESMRSGMNVKGSIRDIKKIEQKGQKYILAAQNNDKPVMFRLKKG
ncbi:MAG: VCBS repeat-containing protein [Chitinophagaceae bacterium]|nr:VCBS repeat-containing protein [Chitinophagaceae bacterium]